MSKFKRLLWVLSVFLLITDCSGSSSKDGANNNNNNSNQPTASNFITIPNGTFVAGQRPAPSVSADKPVVDGVVAPNNQVKGSSQTYTVTFHDPNGEIPLNRANASATLDHMIVHVDGDSGYYVVTITSAELGTFTFTISINGNITGDTINFFMAVVDADGNVSEYFPIAVGVIPGAVCGNNICEVLGGETEANCPDDCSSGPICGNGVCDAGEDSAHCLIDCPGIAVCGNGTCETGEHWGNCPADCSMGSAVCVSVPTNPPCSCTGGSIALISCGDAQRNEFWVTVCGHVCECANAGCADGFNECLPICRGD